MPSARVRRHKHVLKALAMSHPSIQKAVLNNPSPELVQCLCECCHNLLRGAVPLTKPQKTKLSRYKQQLRKVACNTTPVKQKTKIIQSGGFIGALLTPILGSVLSRLFR